MNDEIRDSELQAARNAWEAPSPSPGMHDRILRVCDRELHRAAAQWSLTAVAALVLVVVVVAWTLELRIRGPIKVFQVFHEPSQRGVTAEHPEVVASPEKPHSPAQFIGRERVQTSNHDARLPITGFYPLMDAPPPFGNGILVRMIVPASTMRIAGLPDWDGQMEASVEADLLIGEDGMARAIRFVGLDRRR